MKPLRISRRQFARRSALGLLALGAGSSALASEPIGADKKPARGVWKIRRNPRALESPVGFPASEIWRYMLSYPFQVSPTMAATYLNLKQCCGPGQDFEGGTDVILFDRIDGLDVRNAVKIARQHQAPNPNAGGKLSAIAKYPGNAGFVPLGAKLSDGRPHPHAGTGFAVVTTSAWPTDNSNGYATYPDRIGLTTYLGDKAYRTLELHQLRYDGKTLQVGPAEVLQDGEVAPGYRFSAGGMGCAIADGEDLLTGMKAIRHGQAAASSGLLRWKYVGGKWRPVQYEAVTAEDNSLEPSVVRDVDGSLLVCARGPRSMGPPLRVWQQGRPSGEWKLRINLQRILPSTPVAICRAVDGTPYIAGNLYQPEFKLPAGLHSDGGISRLEPVGWRGERSTLCVWPLNEERNDLAAHFIARDPRAEFGLPPHGTVWAVDHPVGSPVRLANGQWHSLLGYRLLEWKENTHFIPPSPQTGSYLDEVISFGPPEPLWNF